MDHIFNKFQQIQSNIQTINGELVIWWGQKTDHWHQGSLVIQSGLAVTKKIGQLVVRVGKNKMAAYLQWTNKNIF